MISECLWIVVNLAVSGRGLILRYYPSIRLEGLRKPTKNKLKQPVAGAENRNWEPWIRSKSVNHSTTTFSKMSMLVSWVITSHELLGAYQCAQKMETACFCKMYSPTVPHYITTQINIDSCLLVAVTRWHRTKCLMHCGHFLIYSAFPSEFQQFLNNPPKLSGKYH
jgi:hypothetical protein